MVATPETTGITEVTPFAVKVTSPFITADAAAAGVTVAVKVTVSPTKDGVPSVTTVVVVFTWLTVAVTGPS
jgi:putative effector of murein hydrolase